MYPTSSSSILFCCLWHLSFMLHRASLRVFREEGCCCSREGSEEAAAAAAVVEEDDASIGVGDELAPRCEDIFYHDCCVTV